MTIARRTRALLLMDVAISVSVLLIHMEMILLAIAYLVSETFITNLSNFMAPLDKINHMIGAVPP